MSKANTEIKELLELAPANEWKDFLFDIQNRFIEAGFIEGLTKKGRSEFSSKMMALHSFFSDLETGSNQ